jgi:hypothetical protein
MPLKELEAKNAKPKDRAYKLADSEGLFLLMQPNGSKLWRMKYRFGGKEKLLSFGACTDLGISAAREKLCAAKQLLAQGKDPMANKADMMPDGEATFLSVAQRWHENRESSLDAAHSQRVWSRLERDVFPARFLRGHGHLYASEPSGHPSGDQSRPCGGDRWLKASASKTWSRSMVAVTLRSTPCAG